jgi:hypothetical protein
MLHAYRERSRRVISLRAPCVCARQAPPQDSRGDCGVSESHVTVCLFLLFFVL